MKSVTINLHPVTVYVSGDTKEELLKNAEEQFIKTIQTKFPGYQYSVVEGKVLTRAEARPGIIVEDNKGILGIITAVNPKTINVAQAPGGRVVQGPVDLFKKSDATFKQARGKRPKFDCDFWVEGDSGYLLKDGKYIEVVVGKNRGSSYSLYPIGGGGYYTLNDMQMKMLFCEDKPKKEKKAGK